MHSDIAVLKGGQHDCHSGTVFLYGYRMKLRRRKIAYDACVERTSSLYVARRKAAHSNVGQGRPTWM